MEMMIRLSIIIWVALIVIIFWLMLRNFTLNKEKPNPHKGETFGFPPGVFRGILTLSLLYFFVVFTVVEWNSSTNAKMLKEASETGAPVDNGEMDEGVTEDEDDGEAPRSYLDHLATAFQMMIAFYFGSKVLQYLSNEDKEKTKAIAANMSRGQPLTAGEFDEENAVG